MLASIESKALLFSSSIDIPADTSVCHTVYSAAAGCRCVEQDAGPAIERG